MTAGTYNFTVEQGATFTRDFVYKDSTNVVVNLTGYSARMHIRPHLESTQILLEATTANAKLTITPLQGKISVVFTPADTNSIPDTEAVYDLELESASGVVTRLIEGSVTFSKQVTR
jgi:hypothetical protein